MRATPLADTWESLRPGFLTDVTTENEAARLRLAFYGGAVAVMICLRTSIPLGQEGVMDAFEAIDAEIRSEARGSWPSGLGECSTTFNGRRRRS